MGKSIDSEMILHKRKINVTCVQETRWVGSKAQEADGFKLWYSGVVRGKNGVGMLLDREVRELLVEVKRVDDMFMAITIVVGGYTLNEVTLIDTLGCRLGGYDVVHGGFGFGDRTGGGTSLLECSKGFDLVIANSCFLKKRGNLITFQSMMSKTQIDYLILKKCDRGLCVDCKVIPGDNLTTQHRLLVMDLEIRPNRRKRVLSSLPRIMWGALTKDKAQELGEKLRVMGGWESSGDVSCMWTMIANCIKEAVRVVLGVLKGFSGGHKGDWWWNKEVQGRVEAKKEAYLKLVESIDEVEKREN
ncbi:uncharacterized protein [Nicotiana tomentosiformis]|uniref:uncharacterized protein n=1 Tax=Nicotiana tomentosiformis TaxID=4098 RepID=UPI00388CCE88